jgi:hypothetical protein
VQGKRRGGTSAYMGLFDKAKDMAGKARDYAEQNPDKVDSMLDKGEAYVDQRTGHKYTEKIGDGGRKVRQYLDGPKAGETEVVHEQPGTTGTTQAPPA